MIGKTFVPPEGDISKAKYIIVGEQPGQKEVRYRRPFVGPAGRELNEDLQAVGIYRQSECYLTNVIKDLDNPLKYYVQPFQDTMSYSKEGLEYIKMLEKELLQSREDVVIIPTGNIALFALCGRKGITNWRGSVLHPTLIPKMNRWLIPTFHPATVIPPKFQYLNKILIQYDLKKAKGIADNGYVERERTLEIKPTFTESIAFLSKCIEEGLRGEPLDYDIETDRDTKQLKCISFSFQDDHALSIPFVDNDGDYFTIGQEMELIRKIAEILENPAIRKCGQNLTFDSTFLLRRYGIQSANMDDTMVAQQILMPEFRKGLDFIASIWTSIPYYKAEGKEFIAGRGAWDRGWRYNCFDSLACREAFPNQMKQLEAQGNVETYERQIKLLPVLAFMMEGGIKIDVEGMTKRYNELEGEIYQAEEDLNKIAGTPLNARSPKQLMEYFYGKLGHSPYKSKGRVSTDEIAMKRLIRKGVKEADYVLKIRRTTKLRSTYLDPSKVDSDGRMRCAYNPVGTLFSRLSSSENIFGSGNNLQNQPHNVLKYFIADKGYIIYSIDLAQAENRIVAYVGRVDTMIKAFEDRLDLHSLTGALISSKPYEQVIEEDKNGKNCHLGSGDKTWRFWGKKANHGLNYDLGYKKFSLHYEIPERDGKFIVERYHSAYPGVRESYHSYVRQQLANGRVITNLLGRRTLLLDRWDDTLFKKGYSCIPQGTVGDIINERGLNYVYYDQNNFKDVWLLMQVHDSIGFQVPLSIGWDKHAEILLKIKGSLETPLITHGQEFVIPADIAMGYSFYKGDMKEIKDHDFPVDVKTLAERLEALDGQIQSTRTSA